MRPPTCVPCPSRPTPRWPSLLAPILLGIGGCGGPAGRPAAQHPPLPPLQLAPQQAELDALAKAAAPPPAAKQKELRELADIVLQLVESDERTAAFAERSLLGDPGLASVLEPALASDKVEVRRRAAWLCGRSNQPLLQFPLLLRLKYETDGEAIVWAADSLQRLGNDTGLAWLASAMNSEKVQQLAGSLSIGILGDRNVKLGEQPTYVELQTQLQQLTDAWRRRGTRADWQGATIDAAQLDHTLAAHLAIAEGFALRPIDEAKWVLARGGALVVPRLMRTLQASEPYLRSMALDVLTQLGPIAHRAGPALLPLLQDPLTASYAVRTLGEIGCQDAVPHLRARLGDPDAEMRAACVQALGVLQDAASAATFEQLLEDPGQPMDVRVNAAFALLCLGANPGADTFLKQREAQHDYHEPTLSWLRDRLATVTR
ncbi:MAG: HEAT repeat domain-containing protein [Planctomycetes bacterium]|nr:HEAT repeat domain-containing protein [Planctomycetota bacterium]